MQPCLRVCLWYCESATALSRDGKNGYTTRRRVIPLQSCVWPRTLSTYARRLDLGVRRVNRICHWRSSTNAQRVELRRRQQYCSDSSNSSVRACSWSRIARNPLYHGITERRPSSFVTSRPHTRGIRYRYGSYNSMGRSGRFSALRRCGPIIRTLPKGQIAVSSGRG